MKNILLVLLLSGLLFACGGNEEKDTPAEEAVQEQMDNVEESAEEAGETMEEAAEDVAEATTETAEKVKDAVTGATTKMTKGGWTGKVVKMSEVISGNYESLNAARVKELVMAGQYVGFLSDGKFYLVFNAGGNYDWKSLAKVADQASVTIEGKVKMVNGISTIMATNVSS